MTSSLKNIISNVNTKISALTTSTALQAVQLSSIEPMLQAASLPITVADIASLPDATLYAGRMIFVLSISAYRYSNGVSWTRNYDTTLVYANTLWTWGFNSAGPLGDGTRTNRSIPGTTAGGSTTWSIVSAGGYQTLAIKTDGTLWTWGRNGGGQLGDGTSTSRSSPGTTAGGGTNWATISTKVGTSAAIKTDGTLWTWGYNDAAQLGDGTTNRRSSPGTTLGGGTTWSSVSAGNSLLAIKTDGTLWTWGCNMNGQLGNGAGSSLNQSSPGTTLGGGTNWSSVSGGSSHTAGIKTDGTLWTWGANGCGQLGTGDIVCRFSPGTTAGGGTNWSSVSGGRSHTAGIKTDGTLWTWGDNSSGKLGTGTTTDQSSPGTTAGGGTTWSSVSAGWYHTSGVKTDGTLWTWGSNAYGRLGDGTTVAQCSPGTTAGGGTNWSSVSSGNNHTAAIQHTPSGFDAL
jgi:alpha-tubulin suppressor-like RCC1 family protein